MLQFIVLPCLLAFPCSWYILQPTMLHVWHTLHRCVPILFIIAHTSHLNDPFVAIRFTVNNRFVCFGVSTPSNMNTPNWAFTIKLNMYLHVHLSSRFLLLLLQFCTHDNLFVIISKWTPCSLLSWRDYRGMAYGLSLPKSQILWRHVSFFHWLQQPP
jgi:hypothetical protein